MGVRADARGVSEVLGAILVFSILIAALGLFQVTIVPDRNAEIEFKHNEGVQQDMGEVQGAISRIAATGVSETVSVNTGMRYPTRMFFLNPGPVSGTFRTDAVGTGQITLANVEATDAETRDYVQGTLSGFQTRTVVYDPSYNLYHNAPETTYLSTVLYNSFDDGVTIQDEGNLISGNRITLVTVEGDLSRTSVGTASFSPEPLSAPARTVSVTGEGGTDISITVPTELGVDTWRNEILDGEPNVVAVNPAGTGEVEIVLDGSVTYELRMAKIGVGSGTTDEGAHYLTEVRGDDTSVQANGRQEIVLEVRDRFNNPVTGSRVNLSVDGPGELSTDDEGPDTDLDNVPTDENGHVTVTYHAPSDISENPKDVDIKASMTGDPSSPEFDSDAKENVSVAVRVVDPSMTASTPSPLLNPPDGVVLNGSVVTDTRCGGGGTCEVAVTFDNTDEANEQTMDAGRFVFYTADSQGHVPGGSEPTAVLQRDGTTFELGGQFEDSIDITIGPSESETLTFQFFASGGNPINVDNGDFFVFSFIIDGQRETYFIAPQESTPGG